MRQFLACAILIVFGHTAAACDVCGGGSGSQLPGMLPQYTGHFIGLQTQFRYFKSIHPALSEASVAGQSDDHYRTIQLWGRYNMGRRMQLYAFLPYHINTSTSQVSSTQSGIGDATILVNRAFIRSADSLQVKHTLNAGGGIKLPSGRYTGTTIADRSGLPNMQPGTGSWDFTLNANYTLRYRNAGIYADAAYIITTANKQAYKYGNKLGTTLTAFCNVQKKKLSLLPQAGVRYEYALHDYDNYERKWLNEQTGGSMMLAYAGLQATWNRAGMQLSCYIPMAQHYAGGNVSAVYRADAGIFILL